MTKKLKFVHIGRYRKKPIPRERVFSDAYSKAVWVLSKFSPGEIQAYTEIKVPHKAGRKYDSPIIKRSQIIKGTGIPASTIHRFQTGEYTPREKSIAKLVIFYNNYQHKHLRSVGANKEDARRLCKLPFEKMIPIIHKYEYTTRLIQYNYEQQNIIKHITHIQWGLAHSNYRYSELEELGKIYGAGLVTGLKKQAPRKRKRRKGYGSHRE